MGGLESDSMVRKGLKLVMSVGCGVRMLLMVEKVALALLRMLFGLYPFRSVISVHPFSSCRPSSAIHLCTASFRLPDS